jgi:hypothetical protein
MASQSVFLSFFFIVVKVHIGYNEVWGEAHPFFQFYVILMRDHFPRLLMEHLNKTKHKTGDINVVYCALCHLMFLTDSGVYSHIQKKHPLVTLKFDFLPETYSFKMSGFKMSGLQNMRCLKHPNPATHINADPCGS